MSRPFVRCRPWSQRARRSAVPAAAVVLISWIGAPLAAAPNAPPAAPPAAADARRVVLVFDRPEDPFLQRIRVEITTIGFTLISIGPARDRETVGPLDAVARREHAAAAIRMLPTRRGVEVWMADETSGRSLLRQVVVDESAAGPNETLVALQTAELLRTSLLLPSQAAPRPTGATASAAAPAPAPSAPPTASSSPTSAAASTAATGRGAAPDTTAPSAGAPDAAPSPPDANPAYDTARQETGLGGGVGTLYSPGGVGNPLQLWLSAHRTFRRGVGLALDLSCPLAASTLDGPEGSARVATYLAGASAFVRLDRAPGPWFGRIGLGAAALYVHSQGQAHAPLVAGSSGELAGAGYARVDGGVQPLSWLRLGLRGVAGVSVERIEFRFAGNDAGSWGRLFAGGFVIGELALQ